MATEVKTETTKPKVDLGLLEEDDEFEEFPADGKWLWILQVANIVSVRKRVSKRHILVSKLHKELCLYKRKV